MKCKSKIYKYTEAKTREMREEGTRCRTETWCPRTACDRVTKAHRDSVAEALDRWRDPGHVAASITEE